MLSGRRGRSLSEKSECDANSPPDHPPVSIACFDALGGDAKGVDKGSAGSGELDSNIASRSMGGL